ncbi:MAG: rod shape-determining protein [Candidatus Dojkabacteria bacterium]|nr:rod shape-determining protein [Candidatus Dojkabacteria bacterium]
MFAKRLGIDLGTANSVVFAEKQGVVLTEPTVVALNADDYSVLAVGNEAKAMLGKTPENVIANRPLRGGVIASYRVTEALLKYFLNKVVGSSRLFRPEVMISVPAGITSVEQRAVRKAAFAAGAGKVWLIPEPLAAAIGAGLPIHTSAGNMIVNMGGGTSEVAIISLNGMVVYNSVRISGDALNESIISYMRRKHGLLIGEQTAEEIKMTIATALPVEKPKKMEVRGRDSSSGLPRAVAIDSNETVEAMKKPLNGIIAAVKKVLEQTPPELSSDVIDRGMVLSGGTALLNNIDALLTKATGVPAYVAEDALYCVVRGTGEALKNLDVLQRSLRG